MCAHNKKHIIFYYLEHIALVPYHMVIVACQMYIKIYDKNIYKKIG